MKEDIFRVSELNQFIKDVINAGFPQALWVCGEIQNYDRNKDKKHIFFELVEKDPNSQDIIARVGLVIFSTRKSFIEEILQKGENAFALKDDIEVKFLCKVDFYSPHGAVRLVVEGIDPIYTLGKLAQEKQKLIALLKQKGVFDKNKQILLSMVALHVGLITSYESAAYNDFLSELKKSGMAFKVFFRNTLMQGKKTEEDVCQAIQELEAVKGLDVIVITRGGGSLADLSYFDSQKIAETIARARVPVLSGIGHEINISVTDLAAHTYAKTPTAIAQFLVSRAEQFLLKIEENGKAILAGAETALEGKNQYLKDLAHQLHDTTRQYLKGHNEKMIRISEALKRRPLIIIKDVEKILKLQGENLLRISKARVINEHNKLKGFEKIIIALHPTNTLKRGFSITRSAKGEILKNSSSVKAGERIITELHRGKLESEVMINGLTRVGSNHPLKR